MLTLAKKDMQLLIKKYDLVFISLSGSITGMSVSDFNEWLQTVVLILTIGGLIWRMIKRKKV